MEPVRHLMRDLTVTCSVELFETYGFSVSVCAEPRDPSIELAGIIGFTREHMRGAMIVGTTSAVLEKSHVSAQEEQECRRRFW